MMTVRVPASICLSPSLCVCVSECALWMSFCVTVFCVCVYAIALTLLLVLNRGSFCRALQVFSLFDFLHSCDLT